MTFSRFQNSNPSSRLLQVMTPEQGRLFRLVSDEATRQGLPLYIVGGFVRDLLLGHPSVDFDLVIEGDAVLFAYSLARYHGGKVTCHKRFRTAQWLLPESLVVGRWSPGTSDTRLSTLDLISARSETYRHPSALPTVSLGGILDDLRRRDFSINTLALCLNGEHSGELIDDQGGQEDLEAGLIRVLHPRSFQDDPTRLIRAVRYEQRYGFKIAPQTLALIPDALTQIALLSAERLRHEMDLILEEENAASMLTRLADLGLLRAVHPDLEWNQDIQSRFLNGMAVAATLEQPPSRLTLGWSLWLMDITTSGLKGLDKKFHFRSGLRDTLQAASALWVKVDSLSGQKPSQCVAILDDLPITATQVVYSALPAGATRQVLADYLESWRYIKARTTGHDLIEHGLAQGPVYQSILTSLRAAWLDGRIKTPAEELDLLEEMLSSNLKQD
jgi:tRNA nucleotidyltransferase (CCA-adding enzyme)